MSLKFHITQNDEDFLAFSICQYLNNPIHRPSFWKNFGKSLLMSLTMLLLLSFFMVFDRLTWIVLLVVFLLIDGGLAAGNVLLWPRMVRKAMKNYVEQIKQQGKLPYDAEFTVEFLDGEIYGSSAEGEKHIPYAELTRILRDEGHLYVMRGAMQAVVLPLRCLDGREEELLAFLHGKLQQHAPQAGAQPS